MDLGSSFSPVEGAAHWVVGVMIHHCPIPLVFLAVSFDRSEIFNMVCFISYYMKLWIERYIKWFYYSKIASFYIKIWSGVVLSPLPPMCIVWCDPHLLYLPNDASGFQSLGYCCKWYPTILDTGSIFKIMCEIIDDLFSDRFIHQPRLWGL